MPSYDDKYFGTVTKNDTNEIRISRRTYKEHTYLDIREHYQLKDSEEWRPTKKGITFKWDKRVLHELANIIIGPVMSEATKDFAPIVDAARAGEAEAEDAAIAERGEQRKDRESYDDDIPF
jgi:hypothetical protein